MLRIIGLIVIAVGCICTVSAFDAAAQSARVTGTVTGAEGRPLSGAETLLIDPVSGAVRYGTATGSDGSFRLDGIRPGAYLFRATFLGYADHEVSLQLSAGSARRVAVELHRTSVEYDEVVVTSSRARSDLTPITYSNMTARELEEQASMKDLPVLLATLPSTTYYSENGNGIGYSTLRMRGFDQRRVAVSINGIPQNDPEDFNVFWINFFDIQNAVQDIQVQRGAGSSFYGPAAIGGAVNIVAVPYRHYPYAEVEVGAGSYDTQRYAAEANTGLVGGRYVAFGRFSRLVSDGYRENSWTEFYRFFGGVVRYGDRSTLTLQAYGGPQEDGLAFSGVPKSANDDEDARRANFSAATGDAEHFHQPHVELLHDWQPAPGIRFHQALFGVKGEGYFDFGATFRSPEYLRLPDGWRGLSDAQRRLPLFVVAPDASLLFRAYLDQWQVGWLPHVTLTHDAGETTLGAEGRLHRSLRWGRMQEASGLPQDLVGEDADARVYSFRGEKSIGSIYGRHLYRDGDRFAVQADLQATFRQYRVYDEAFFGHAFEKPYVFLNPRVGVTVHPEQPLSGYASVALAHREPRLKSLYDGEEAGAGFEPRFERGGDGQFDYGRALVSPERLVDVELGGKWNGRSARVSANVYWMEFWDEIVPSGGLDQFGVPRTGNADRTRHVGVEVEGAAALTRSLSVFGNATLSRNRFVSFTEFVSSIEGDPVSVERDGNPIAGFPERMGHFGLRFERAGWTARLAGRYVGRQYIDNSAGGAGDGFEVDPYVLLDASVHVTPRFIDGLRLSVDVNNVLDDRVLLFGNVGPTGPQFFPTATRHVFFGATYRVR
ncbi:MAG: TonB-dependent receptor [Rhodothermales bacterium]